MPDSITVKIKKSDIPIIWLDTSIINSMTQWKNKMCKLDEIQEKRISKLYNLIYDNTRRGKLICPLAEQESEVWVERDKWFDTIHTFSLGISTRTLQSIHDKQFIAFMNAYVKGEKEITLHYRDAFHSDPVQELKTILLKPFFVAIRRLILFGADHQKRQKKDLLSALDKARKENVDDKIRFKEQLEQEYLGDLRALITLQNQYFANLFGSNDNELNSFFGTIQLNKQLHIMKELTGKSLDYVGLTNFYKSAHYRAMPYINLSCNFFARIMTDNQPIRSGDVMDINHASTLMPYSNIFITDKAMSAFLKKRAFNKLYDTKVCYIGDSQIIDEFFSNL